MKWMLIAGSALVAGVFTGAVIGESVEPEIYRHADDDNADAPSGRLLLRMPAADAVPGKDVPSEGGEPPAEPDDRSYRDEDAPTFFGEPQGDWIALLLDKSNSMSVRDGGGSVEDADGNIVSNPRRCDLVSIETIKLLRALGDEASVAIIEFGGNTNHWNSNQIEPPVLTVLEGDDGPFISMAGSGRETAINFVNSTITQLRLGTPTYSALKFACENCQQATNFNLLTDGAPTVCDTSRYDRSPGWKYDVAQAEILGEFPGWWAPLESNGCKLTCFKIGDNSYAVDFLQRFCAAFNGKYIDR